MLKVGNVQETANVSVQENVQNCQQVVEKQQLSKGFLFLNRKLNPEYEGSLKTVPLRSCLLLNKGAVSKEWIIKTIPKWRVDLLQTDYSRETGEILGQSVYTTDDLTSANNRKIKAVNAFCERFKAAYKAHKVSMFFYTLTIANQAKTTIRDAMKAYTKRLKRRGIKLHGYIWVLEISDGLHVHYHALVVTDRIDCRGKELPEYLKLDDLWGANTQVQFVRKNIQYYLSKYFVKNKNRILHKRQYGVKIADKKRPLK